MLGRKSERGLLMVLLCVTFSCRLVRGGDGFRCCTPHAWRTTVRTLQASVIEGVNTFSEIWQVVNYDAENERIANSLTLVDGKPEKQRVVLDIQKHARYVIENETSCTRFNVSGPFNPVCTPRSMLSDFAFSDYTNVVSRLYLGSYYSPCMDGYLGCTHIDNAVMVAFGVAPILSPLEGVYANTVYYNTEEITGQVTITVGSCALVAETVYFLGEGVNIVQNTQYLNQTLSFDETAFDVPHDCKPAEVVNFASVMRHFGLLKETV